MFGPQIDDDNKKSSGGNKGEITAEGSNDIENATVTIPPGALSVETTVTLESTVAINTLAVSQFAEIESASEGGPAVLFEAADANATLSSPATLALPVTENLSLVTTQYAVLYEREDDGGTKVGILKVESDQIKEAEGNKTVEVQVSYFGKYQVIIVALTVVVDAIQEAAVTEPSLEEPLLSLQGTWQGNNCYYSFNFGGHVGYSFEVNGFNFENKITFWVDDSCETPYWSYIMLGTLTTSPTDDQAVFNVDMNVTSIKVTPFTSGAVDYKNGVEYCGKSDWAEGVEQEFLGTECAETKPMPGETIYDIFSVDATNLKFGAPLPLNQDEVSRPTAIITTSADFFTKQ